MLESFTCLGRKKGGGGSKPRVHYWPTITLSFSECFDFASLGGSGMAAPKSGRLTVIPSSHGKYVDLAN